MPNVMYHISGILIKYLASNVYETEHIKNIVDVFKQQATVDDFTLTNSVIGEKTTAPKANIIFDHFCYCLC